MARRRSARTLATLVLYAAAVVWLTWPLAPNATGHLANTAGPSSTDVPYIAWALAWQSHALATDPARYLDANIYAPAPRALTYGDPGLAALPFFAPVFLATGNPTLAINVVFFLGLALTAWALHVVVERWTGSWLAGLVGATTFLTNPWTIPWFFGWAPTYTVLCGLPIVAYLVARPIARPIALAFLVALQASGNMVYVAVSTLVPLAVLAAWRLARGRTRASGVRLAGVLVVAGALLAPVYVEYASVRAENTGLERQSAWARLEMPADASGAPIVAPRRFPRLLPAALLWRRDPTGLAPSVAVLVLAGAVAVATRRRREAGGGLASLWRHGLLWTGVGLCLSTAKVRWGALLLVNPLYTILERWAPFANAVLREHVRLGLPCVVGWAFLAGAALVACGRAAPRRHAARVRLVLATAAVAGAIVSHRATAVPVGLLTPTAHAEPIGRMLATIQGGVLELPLGAGGIDPHHHAPAMYRSIGGWYRLLNGYSSYWPASFPARMALAERVPDDDAVVRLVHEADLAAVVVNLLGCAPDARADWLARAAAGGAGRLRLAVRDPRELLFLVDRSGIE